MATVLTPSKLIAYIAADVTAGATIPATPNSDTLDLLQQCIDAAVEQLEQNYTLPAMYTAAVEQAILIQSMGNWLDRNSANGIVAFAELGAVRAPRTEHPAIGRLLGHLKQFRFG